MERLRRAPVAVALVAGLLAVAPDAHAGPIRCRATNVTDGAPARATLQRAIDAADPGDTIAIRGRCVGAFRVTKDLSLLGKPSPGLPRPVLLAPPDRSALEVAGPPAAVEVTLTNLRITGGSGEHGGIHNDGTLVLRRSVVSGNRVGITNHGGLSLAAGTLVRRNAGAGIANAFAVTLHGTSSVRGNDSRRSGGGIDNVGVAATVVLNDASSVSANATTKGGGGIYNAGGTVVMNDASRVSRNTAFGDGGGILNVYVAFYGTVILNDEATVWGNRADANGEGAGRGGGIWNCSVLTGAEPGVNVHDNHRGKTAGTVDDVFQSTC